MAIKNVKEAKKNIRIITKQIIKQFKDVLYKNSKLLTSRIRSKYMTGGTSANKLRTRTGKLKASTKPICPKIIAGNIKAGVSVGTIYAGIHLGRRGKVTTLRPKKKYLAIPTPQAMTPRGVARGKPNDEHLWGKTWVTKAKTGKKNLIIVGMKKFQKGAKAGQFEGGGKIRRGSRKGQARGKIVTLFILKKQVKVRTRIHPDELLKKVLLPKIQKDMDGLKKVKVAA